MLVNKLIETEKEYQDAINRIDELFHAPEESEEALKMAKEAISLYVEDLDPDGEPFQIITDIPMRRQRICYRSSLTSCRVEPRFILGKKLKKI